MTIPILVVDHNGIEHEFETPEGWRVTEIDGDWRDRRPSPSEGKMVKLGDASLADIRSQLSC